MIINQQRVGAILKNKLSDSQYLISTCIGLNKCIDFFFLALFIIHLNLIIHYSLIFSSIH